jgi:hypothetical protein
MHHRHGEVILINATLTAQDPFPSSSTIVNVVQQSLCCLEIP